MSDGYAIQFDLMRSNYLIQEIEAHLQDIKEHFNNLEQLTNLVNRQQNLAIPDCLKPFLQKYIEIPAEKREVYLTCFSSEEQGKIRNYANIKENELKLSSFEEEVGKTQYFANLRYPDRASPPENPHKSERSIWVAGIPSCLSPKGRGQPAVRIAT